jgi:hypothetical protein
MSDPDVYKKTVRGEEFRRRKMRIGCFARPTWANVYIQVEQSFADAADLHQDLIVLNIRGESYDGTMQAVEAYSPHFDDKPEGMEMPFYERIDGVWVAAPMPEWVRDAGWEYSDE